MDDMHELDSDRGEGPLRVQAAAVATSIKRYRSLLLFSVVVVVCLCTGAVLALLNHQPNVVVFVILFWALAFAFFAVRNSNMFQIARARLNYLSEQIAIEERSPKT